MNATYYQAAARSEAALARVYMFDLPHWAARFQESSAAYARKARIAMGLEG